MLKYPEMCTIFLDISRLIFQNIWKLSLLHKHMFPDKGKNNPWSSYVKKLFPKFHDKYQKTLQKSQIYVIIQRSIFSINQTKSSKLNIKHQFSKYTCRYTKYISLLVRVSGTVNKKRSSTVSHCSYIGLVPVQF